MRIPLDYYRILGLPVQASHEQLQQAYRDRIVQLPRREYSDAAVAARKQLLEAAYAVLSEPKQRAFYDTSYLAHTYNSETQGNACGSSGNFLEQAQNLTEGKVGEHPALLPVAFAPHTPSIEIPDEQLVGALLILQELGEYELVLQLGPPYLSSNNVVRPEAGVKSTLLNQVQSDIILTVSLAHLELGREQWQQGKYENAAASLEAGQELLLHEGLFPNIQAEIQADLDKLRPYRILELLARPEENVTERRQGLQLLQKLLQARGGIDGTGEDGSGLSMDDFLRFIQQLRSYLTVAEQQNLFDPYQRSSAVTAYLVVYGLIAQGFAQRLPASIARAKLLLLRLGKHQDLYVEQAVCSLLLGQTRQANNALELSQEYETLAFIREHSQGSPDLLPGLCLYGERWLQTEVFPHFRDLTQQQASLKDYFADEQVQSYLEALPAETETSLQAPLSANSNESKLLSQSSTHSLRQQTRAKAKGIQTPSQPIPATAILNVNPDSSVIPRAASSSGPTPTYRQIHSPNATTLTKNHQPRRSKRQRRSGGLGLRATSETLRRRWGRMSSRDFKQVLAAKRARLILLAVVGVLGIVVLSFLVKQSFRSTSGQKPPSQGLPQTSQANQLPPSIPKPSSTPLATTGLLNPEQAQSVIQTWLSTKAAAFGPSHVDGLKQILVEPALSKWQQLVQNDKAANQYLKYNERGLKINSINTSQTKPNQAEVEAIVNEVAQVYKNGKLDRDSSYDKSLRVKYHFVRQGNQWRIDDMGLLN